jgi:hypothetical protein
MEVGHFIAVVPRKRLNEDGVGLEKGTSPFDE